MDTKIRSTDAAMRYALRHGTIPAALFSPALLADLIERGWALPAQTPERALVPTPKGRQEWACH